jgi:hypothetical protein
MSLIGRREAWRRLAYEANDRVLDLKEEHVACIAQALRAAPADAEWITVDAMLPARQQARDRLPAAGAWDPVRGIAQLIADDDERWWRWRAQQLDIDIRPVEPWPRRPDLHSGPPYIRPPDSSASGT